VKARDVQVSLDHRPGALAEFGEVLGRAGVSLEGGGVFVHDGVGVAHFLVDDGPAAAAALSAAGLQVVAVRDVVTLRLHQGIPGQLGTLCRKLAIAGVQVEAQYSDHDHRLVLVVEEEHHAAALDVAAEWTNHTQP
jgi:hypothetical protein